LKKIWQKSVIGAALLMATLFMSVGAFAADDTPTLVEVYWRSKKSILIPNSTSVIALKPEHVNAEIANGVVTFYGVARGAETVVLVFIGDKPVSIRVNVIDPPSERLAPRLKNREELADVTLSSTMQTSSNALGLRQFGFTSGVTWQQDLDKGHHFEFSTESTAGSLASASSFNLNHGNIGYFAPTYEIQVLDFPVNLYGNEGAVVPGSLLTSDYTSLRGAEFTFHRRRQIHCLNLPIPRMSKSLVERKINAASVASDCGPSTQDVTTYKFYAGTTQPYYFLNLSGTSDVVGFSFNHRLRERFVLYGNASYMNVPLRLYTTNPPRHSSGVQTVGLAYNFRQNWHFAADGGVSTQGGMGRGEVRYTSRRLDLGAAAATSAAQFPYNQLLNTTSGTQGLRANALFRSSDRLTETVTYNRSTTKEITGFVEPGTYQYLAPGIDFMINHSNDLNIQYAWSESTTAGTQGSTTSNQYNASWNSLLPRQITNAVQFSIGSIQDPLQLHAGDTWSLRDSVRMPISHGTLSLSFGHNESDPSMAQRISGRLGLLPLALQQAFLADPIGFLNSGNLPADVRAILENSNPTGTYFNVNGQFQVTPKLVVAPNFAFSSTSDGDKSSWSPTFGYGLHYAVTRSLQINSNLSTIWYSDSTLTTRRTSVFSVGVVKQLFVAPAAILPSTQSRAITGRVFRDNNINGTYNSGEPGLAGVRVQIDGKEIVTTDSEGRYRFTHVSADVHQIVLAMSDLKAPIRMTTAHQQEADLLRTGRAEINFGVVNFAKVMGLVFNDAKFTGQSGITSKGMQKVRMTLKSASGEKTIVSEGSGEYESTDVAPGDYELVVDQASLPANYWMPVNSIPVHVNPVSTSVIDVPIRALRSIGGRVLLRIPKVESQGFQNSPQSRSNDYETVALAGVTIIAGDVRTQSAADGSFLLRNLPAGNLTVTIVPVKPLPAELKLPAGRVHLPDDPTEVHDATIVISNPALMPYLVGKTVEQIRNIQPDKKSKYPTVATK
jgi:hypothetical protein